MAGFRSPATRPLSAEALYRPAARRPPVRTQAPTRVPGMRRAQRPCLDPALADSPPTPKCPEGPSRLPIRPPCLLGDIHDIELPLEGPRSGGSILGQIFGDRALDSFALRRSRIASEEREQEVVVDVEGGSHAISIA